MLYLHAICQIFALRAGVIEHTVNNPVTTTTWATAASPCIIHSTRGVMQLRAYLLAAPYKQLKGGNPKPLRQVELIG
jgi:hypothetical protein